MTVFTPTPGVAGVYTVTDATDIGGGIYTLADGLETSPGVYTFEMGDITVTVTLGGRRWFGVLGDRPNVGRLSIQRWAGVLT